MSDEINNGIPFVLITQEWLPCDTPCERAGRVTTSILDDPVVLANQAHAAQLLQDQPLTLLGQTSHFFMGHLLQEFPYGLGYSDFYPYNEKCYRQVLRS